MFACAHCGNELPDGASFCNQCWKTVEPSPTVPAKTVPAPVEAAATDPGSDPTTVMPLGGQPDADAASGPAVDPLTPIPYSPPPGIPTFQAPYAPPPGIGAEPVSAGYPSAPPARPESPWATPSPGPEPTVGWGPPTGPPPGGPTPEGSPAWGPPPGSPSPWDAPAPTPGAWGAAPPPPGSYGYGYGVGTYSPAPYAAPGYYGAPVVGTNGMAIASLVCSLVSVLACGLSAPLGIIFGHVALSQIKKTGANGRGMAIAGLVIGYLLLIGFVALIVLGVASNNGSNY